MRYRLQWVVLLVVGVLVLASCGGATVGGGQHTGRFPMTVSNCGHQVRLKHPPKHVFAERDTSTTVAAAGAADRLVARSGEADVPLGRYRAQLAKVRQVTKHSADPPSPETVVGTGADLVIAGHVTRQDVQALEAVGIPVIVPSWFCQQVYGSTAPVTFDDTYRTLRLLGQVFDTEHTTHKTVSNLHHRVTTVKQRFAKHPPRTAANVYIAPSLLQVYGGLSVNNIVLHTLGLGNVFASIAKRDVEVDSESLVARNPKIVVLSYGTSYGISTGRQAKRAFTKQHGLDRLAAVRNHKLLTLNYGYLTGGPLTVDGLETLANQLATTT